DRCLLRYELRSRALDIGSIGLDDGGRCVRLRPRLLAGIAREDAAFDQLRLTFARQLEIFSVSGITGELRFGLRQGRLERPAIEREENLAFFDEVALVKRDLLEQPGHLRADGNRRVGFDIADRRDFHRYVSFSCVRCDNRRITTAASTAASATA